MNQLKLNIFANFIGRGWTNIIGILFVPLYLKFMGIEAYGLIGFFTMLQGLLSFLDLGIGATINREMARLGAADGKIEEQRDLLRTLETIYWSISIFCGLIVIIAAPVIANDWINARNLPIGSVTTAIRLMGLTIILQFPLSFYQGGLMGLQRQVLLNFILVIVGTLRGVGAVLVLWLISPTIQSFLVWQLVMSMLGSGLFIYYLWGSLPASGAPARFRPLLLKGVWRYAAAMSGNSIIGVVLTQLDKVILSKMLSLEMFGYYTIAGSLAVAIWSIIVPFNNALFPRFVQLFETHNTSELHALFHRSSQVLAVVLLPVTMILVSFPREILLIWTHNSLVAENASILASLLVLGASINGLSSIPAYAVSAFGWPQLITYTNLLQAVILVPAIIVMVSLYGAVGAGIVWVGLNCTYVLIMMPVMFRRYFVSEKKEWYIKDVGLPLMGSIIIGVIAHECIPSGIAPLEIIVWIAGAWLLCTIMTAMLSSYVRDRVIGFF